MSQGLQENERRTRETSTPVRTTRLILDREFYPYILKELRKKPRTIEIINYAWRFYPNEPGINIQILTNEIVKNAKRGCAIRVICNEESTRSRMRAYQIPCKKIPSNKLMHTKAILFNQQELIIGSHNLTKRAMNENYEMSISTNETENILQFMKYFNTMWEYLSEN